MKAMRVNYLSIGNIKEPERNRQREEVKPNYQHDRQQDPQHNGNMDFHFPFSTIFRQSEIEGKSKPRRSESQVFFAGSFPKFPILPRIELAYPFQRGTPYSYDPEAAHRTSRSQSQQKNGICSIRWSLVA